MKTTGLKKMEIGTELDAIDSLIEAAQNANPTTTARKLRAARQRILELHNRLLYNA